MGAEVRCWGRGMNHTLDGRGGGDNTQARGWGLDGEGEREGKRREGSACRSPCLPSPVGPKAQEGTRAQACES